MGESTVECQSNNAEAEQSARSSVDISVNVTTKAYWDHVYSLELEDFFDNPSHTGEEWFEDRVEDIVEWIDNEFLPDTEIERISANVIDVGCGNGLFCLRLGRMGFKHIYGIDYSPNAIRLGRRVIRHMRPRAGSRPLTPDDEKSETERRKNIPPHRHPPHIILEMMDVTQPLSPVSPATDVWPKDPEEEGGESEPLTWNIIADICHSGKKFDLVHDKGTFDIFYMRGQLNDYLNAVAEHFIKEDGYIVVTSCNTTTEELREAFETWSHLKLRFEAEAVLNHPSIFFAGSRGQTISTLAFQLIRSRW